MSSPRDFKNASITEPFAITDLVASDIAKVDEIEEGFYRLTFTTRMRSPYDDSAEHVVVARLVVTSAALDRMIDKLVAARPNTRHSRLVAHMPLDAAVN